MEVDFDGLKAVHYLDSDPRLQLDKGSRDCSQF